MIVRQGEMGDNLYLIKEGTVRVCVDFAEVRRMHAGEFFGEQGLLYDCPSTATIIAAGSVSCLSLNHAALTSTFGTNLQAVIYRNSIKIALENSSVLNQVSPE